MYVSFTSFFKLIICIAHLIIFIEIFARYKFLYYFIVIIIITAHQT